MVFCDRRRWITKERGDPARAISSDRHRWITKERGDQTRAIRLTHSGLTHSGLTHSGLSRVRSRHGL